MSCYFCWITFVLFLASECNVVSYFNINILLLLYIYYLAYLLFKRVLCEQSILEIVHKRPLLHLVPSPVFITSTVVACMLSEAIITFLSACQTFVVLMELLFRLSDIKQSWHCQSRTAHCGWFRILWGLEISCSYKQRAFRRYANKWVWLWFFVRTLLRWPLCILEEIVDDKTCQWWERSLLTARPWVRCTLVMLTLGKFGSECIPFKLFKWIIIVLMAVFGLSLTPYYLSGFDESFLPK